MTLNPSTSPGDTPATTSKPRRVFRRIRVTRTEQLTPHMVRVTFTGDDLAAFGWNGPAAHIKLVFPEEGQSEPAMPQPDGPRLPNVRTYTPRRFDPAVPELEVEFVLHGDGPASNWAEQVQVGQSLVMAGPGPNYQIDPAADWYLLAGDDTAVPAISSILDNLPATARAYVLLEVGDAQEEQVLHSPAELNVTWLHRGSRPADAALEQAVRDFKLPTGNGRIYVGCEAGVMRRIRQHLLRERGLDATRLVTRGYWKLDAVAYTDNDYGTD
jgi:NADPH-dependent ferric siderophore reductase